jgi:hypothetical protein
MGMGTGQCCCGDADPGGYSSVSLGFTCFASGYPRVYAYPSLPAPMLQIVRVPSADNVARGQVNLFNPDPNHHLDRVSVTATTLSASKSRDGVTVSIEADEGVFDSAGLGCHGDMHVYKVKRVIADNPATGAHLYVEYRPVPGSGTAAAWVDAATNVSVCGTPWLPVKPIVSAFQCPIDAIPATAEVEMTAGAYVEGCTWGDFSTTKTLGSPTSVWQDGLAHAASWSLNESGRVSFCNLGGTIDGGCAIGAAVIRHVIPDCSGLVATGTIGAYVRPGFSAPGGASASPAGGSGSISMPGATGTSAFGLAQWACTDPPWDSSAGFGCGGGGLSNAFYAENGLYGTVLATSADGHLERRATHTLRYSV